MSGLHRSTRALSDGALSEKEKAVRPERGDVSFGGELNLVAGFDEQAKMGRDYCKEAYRHWLKKRGRALCPASSARTRCFTHALRCASVQRSKHVQRNGKHPPKPGLPTISIVQDSLLSPLFSEGSEGLPTAQVTSACGAGCRSSWTWWRSRWCFFMRVQWLRGSKRRTVGVAPMFLSPGSAPGGALCRCP